MSWFDDPAFWEAMAPIWFDARRQRSAAAEVAALLALIRPPDRARILDAGCGTGRHARLLAERGFRVTGVDQNAAYLARATGFDAVHADLRTWRRPGRFDLVLSLATSFGFHEDPADDAAVVEGWYADLVPGGQVLIDVMGREVFARNFQEKTWFETDGAVVLESRRVVDDWRAVETTTTLLRDGESRLRATQKLRLYSADGLVTLLSRAGFVRPRVWGSVTGTAYDQNALRLLVCAEKP